MSIKEVTDAIVKAVGFQGEYTVCILQFLINSFIQINTN